MRAEREMNILNPSTEKGIKASITAYPGISIHASLPCTVWCLRQYVNLSTLGPDYAKQLETRREESRAMVRAFVRIAELAIHNGGAGSFGPRSASDGPSVNL